MPSNRLLGAWGEAKAAEYLRKNGYKILASRFQCRFGEIDLIAQKGNTLVFVEVKLRKSGNFALAREFVNPHKQDRIRMSASIYLSRHPSNRKARFDVIELYAPQGIQSETLELNHLEDAFQ